MSIPLDQLSESDQDWVTALMDDKKRLVAENSELLAVYEAAKEYVEADGGAGLGHIRLMMDLEKAVAAVSTLQETK